MPCLVQFSLKEVFGSQFKHNTHISVFLICDKMFNHLEQSKRHLTCLKYGNEDFIFSILFIVIVMDIMCFVWVHDSLKVC